ncbi:hypothetical protein K458DRAFT_381284 [Lentithecium fluviatile CBS 122367]|uniref:Uncharacterized protein n=1 Tax=Lentithecium fluviatile CBS 122367 TaxID=1168545 RepID=A0A6G1JLI0_9PLEO|nr:hypothetical protein K458DRAFT_381284 [Lentithecium fluviatile CBS 122367]
MAQVDRHITASPEPIDREALDEGHRISSDPAAADNRVDSAIAVSPVLTAPIRTHLQPSFDTHHFVYPPLITGHGHLVKARQTVPNWVGALVVVGGFAWIVGCAICI